MYIINNTSFAKHGERQGSNFDVDNLMQLADKLDMTSKPYQDLTGQVGATDLLLYVFVSYLLNFLPNTVQKH